MAVPFVPSKLDPVLVELVDDAQFSMVGVVVRVEPDRLQLALANVGIASAIDNRVELSVRFDGMSGGFTGYCTVLGRNEQQARILEVSLPTDVHPVQHRRHIRIEVDWPCEIRSRGTSPYERAYTIDASRGGLQIQADGPHVIDEHLDIHLTTPGNLNPLLLRGAVARRHLGPPLRLGIRFDEMDTRAQQTLVRALFLAQRRAMQLRVTIDGAL